MESTNAAQLFDKVTILYEGKQIYFGSCDDARAYFFDLGYVCGPRQTTADFLTSLTSPTERRIRPNYDQVPPRTSSEFHAKWKKSSHFVTLLKEIEDWNQKYPVGGPSVRSFLDARKSQQAKRQ